MTTLIGGLTQLGIRVTAIAWGSSASDAYHDPELACDVIPLSISRPAAIRNQGRTSRELAKILDRIDPDLVHFVCIPELARHVHRPKIFSLHGLPYLDEWLYGKRRRWLTAPLSRLTFNTHLKRFDHVIIHNTGELEPIRLRSKLELFEIDNPVEDEFFESTPRADTPTVLFVGRLCALKNILGLVQAAALVRTEIPNVRFRIAGTWSSRDHPQYRVRVERFCADNKLANTVSFLGDLSREEIKQELEAATCLLLPSFQEMAPAVIGEAMASGVPVAASEISGIPALLGGVSGGILFDPHSVPDIAQSVVKLARDKNLRRTLSEQGRREAARFRIERVASMHVEAYKSVLRAHEAVLDESRDGARPQPA